MSLPTLVKIGAALGLGGLVYWGITALGGAPTATGAPLPAKKKPPTGGGGAAPSGGGPTGEISGTTNAGDDVSGTTNAKLDASHLAVERRTTRPGYRISPTETWRDPYTLLVQAIWYRLSDNARGVFLGGSPTTTVFIPKAA
jgi:hypothetical protein